MNNKPSNINELEWRKISKIGYHSIGFKKYISTRNAAFLFYKLFFKKMLKKLVLSFYSYFIINKIMSVYSDKRILCKIICFLNLVLCNSFNRLQFWNSYKILKTTMQKSFVEHVVFCVYKNCYFQFLQFQFHQFF